MPDVFALLEQDHRNVEQLFTSFARTQDPEIALRLCDELTIHSIVEEELVYPLLAAKVGQGQAMEAREEHAQAKGLVSGIEAAVRRGSDLGPLVGELHAVVAHHVQEEEAEIFPAMRRKLPDIVATMGDEVLARRLELQEQLVDARSLGETSAVVALKVATA